MDLKTTTEVISNIATSSAFVVGGIWAYVKFIRGRVFARRAELYVSATLERSVRAEYISILITLKNTGSSKLPLNENMKAVRLSGLAGNTSQRQSPPGWERLATLPILQQHAWLEAQESVTDIAIYNLSHLGRAGQDREAYLVEAIVGAPRHIITGKGVRWQSHAIIFPARTDPGEHKPKRQGVAAHLTGINGFTRKISNQEAE